MFFTADHHFGHGKIIGLCARPFTDVEEMNEAMISTWNQTVGRRDDVWHLGDFAFRGGADFKAGIFSRLNGRKRLVVGNHDDKATLSLPWSDPPVQLARVAAEGVRLVLCHYGLRVWPGLHRGAIHLYGHSHGRLPGSSLCLDVGVDSWNYRPVSVHEILRHTATMAEFVDPEVR